MSQAFQVSNEILLAAISLIVAILTVVVPLSWRFIQARRLRLEEAISRESHNLKLFEALASANHHLQLASAAVLAERLTSTASRAAKAEHRVIIIALLAVTKDLRTSLHDPIVPQEVSKFIADQVGKNHQIPLREFDWQNTQLARAWWPAVNASGVDFWRSDLRFAGMRDADLSQARLVEVRLDDSVLVGANLTDAWLDRASLLGTDLRGAKLEGARFTGAVYNDHTQFPAGFDPIARGLIKQCGVGHNIPRPAALAEATI